MHHSCRYLGARSCRQGTRNWRQVVVCVGRSWFVLNERTKKKGSPALVSFFRERYGVVGRFTGISIGLPTVFTRQR